MKASEPSITAVLAEKPSVARDVARVLGADKRGEGYLQGNGCVVTWAIGHLVSLAQPTMRELRSGQSLPAPLDRVRKGARLILVGADAAELSEAMMFLTHNNVLSFGGTAGPDNTAWVGHWYFGKKHWLLDGLPSDCVFDWQYQAGAGGDGLIVDAPGIEAVVGYGKNPGPGLGLGAAVIPYSQGEIVVLGISGLTAAFTENAPNSFQPIVATRILYNVLHKENDSLTQE